MESTQFPYGDCAMCFSLLILVTQVIICGTFCLSVVQRVNGVSFHSLYFITHVTKSENTKGSKK